MNAIDTSDVRFITVMFLFVPTTGITLLDHFRSTLLSKSTKYSKHIWQRVLLETLRYLMLVCPGKRNCITQMCIQYRQTLRSTVRSQGALQTTRNQ